MSGYHFGLESFAQCFGQRNRVQENGRLGYFGLAQFFVAAGEHGLTQGKTEDLVRAVEQGFHGRRFLVKVGPHSGELGSLSREYVCFHFF